MAVRYNCENCGETYHEENIDVCVKCGRMVCPRCAGIVYAPDGKGREWRCDGCKEKAK